MFNLDRFKKLSLFQKFSIMSFLWLLAAGLAGGFLVAYLMSNSILEREAQTVSSLIRAFIRHEGLDDAFLSPNSAETMSRFKNAFKEIRGISGLIRIKVYDPGGNVIWSDEPRLIGRRFYTNKMKEALRGDVVYELEIPEEEEHKYEKGLAPSLIEYYIPVIGLGGEVIGSVEIYQDATPLLHHIRKTKGLIWGVTILGGLVIYLSMQFMVRRSSSLLIRMQKELEEYSRGLEKKVMERTRELEEANLSLKVASRHKSEFIAMMSHELRTPLNSIIGFSEVLIDRKFGELNQKQTKYLNYIYESGKHLLSLINDILDLSRIEAGKTELHPQEFPLSEALKGAIAIIRPQAVKKGITLGLDVKSPSITITSDLVRFKQIMYNLLSNAVKFTPSGGNVRVSAHLVQGSQFTDDGKEELREPLTVNRERHGDFVEIAVQDTGIGIKKENQKLIFQPFTQVDSSISRRHEGTGLGLCLTRRFVEMHGGRIWVESEGEGKGSTFTFTLPLSSHSRIPEAQRA